MKTLYSLVSTNHKKFLAITWVMASILLKTFYISIVQYFNNALVQVNKNTYELTYTVGGNMYKLLIRMKRGPKKAHLCV